MINCPWQKVIYIFFQKGTLTEKLFLLLQRESVEYLPEKFDGGMVLPVLPFVFSTLKRGDRKLHHSTGWAHISSYYISERQGKGYVNRDLLQLCPVIVGVANHHGLQLVGLEQLEDFSTAHLVEACIEVLKQRIHWCVENIVYVCVDKLLPRGKKSRIS